MTLYHNCEKCMLCIECHQASCETSEEAYAIKTVENNGWIEKICPYCGAVMDRFKTLETLMDEKKDCYEKFDEIMMSGLQFRFFNKPVKTKLDDGMDYYDIMVFWQHVDVCTSEPFETAEECLDDCLRYLKNYNE